MSNSSRLCREQEIAQRLRAEQTPLQQVREAAVRAAQAWCKEAVSAEAREAREAARRQDVN